MQTIEEYKAYTQQLEGEVSKWHHAYDNLMIERNELVAKVMNLETVLDKVNRLFDETPKQDSATEIDTLTSGLKNLKGSLEACSSELEELRKHEVELDLSKARILELEKNSNSIRRQIMEIKAWDKDLKLIANNQKMGGGSHTALEIALARKCLDLQSALHKVKEQQQTYFDALTSIHCLVDKKAGERIRERRAKDLKSELKSNLKQSA